MGASRKVALWTTPWHGVSGATQTSSKLTERSGIAASGPVPGPRARTRTCMGGNPGTCGMPEG